MGAALEVVGVDRTFASSELSRQGLAASGRFKGAWLATQPFEAQYSDARQFRTSSQVYGKAHGPERASRAVR